jgi:hypothetical protein
MTNIIQKLPVNQVNFKSSTINNTILSNSNNQPVDNKAKTHAVRDAAIVGGSGIGLGLLAANSQIKHNKLTGWNKTWTKIDWCLNGLVVTGLIYLLIRFLKKHFDNNRTEK